MKYERLPNIPASEALNKVRHATGKTPKRLYEFNLGDLYKTVSGKDVPFVEAKLGEDPFSDVLYQGETFANKAKTLVEGKIGIVNSQLATLREGLETEKQKLEFDQLVKSYERSRRGLLGAAVRHKVFEKVDFSIKDDVLTVASSQEQKPYAQYLNGMRLGERARANLEKQRKREELRDKQETIQDEAMLVAYLPGEDIFTPPIIASHEEINSKQEAPQQATEGGSVEIFTSNGDSSELYAEGISDLPGEDIFTSISEQALEIPQASLAPEDEAVSDIVDFPEQSRPSEQSKMHAEIAALPGVEIFV